MSLSRRLFFGSLVGAGSAAAFIAHGRPVDSIQVDVPLVPPVIQDGDVLVIEHPHELSQDGIRNLQTALSVSFPGVKVVVLDGGMKARLLRPEAGEYVITLDGRVLAEEVAPHLPAVLRRQGL